MDEKMFMRQQLETLQAYAAGERGTRTTIETLGVRDYADLVIALAAHDLALPRPPDSPARAILQPRLRRGLDVV